MSLKCIVLHGGYGTRLRPLTHTGPKQMIPVANKPISQYVLEDLVEVGVKEIAIVLGDIYPEKVKEHYGDGSAFSAKLSYIYQGEPKGIAHAISLCKEYVNNEPFIVYLGDNLLKGLQKRGNYNYMMTALLTLGLILKGVHKVETCVERQSSCSHPKRPIRKG